MDLSSYSIPISMLRQHCFCPRIPFFYLIRELKPVTGQWVSQGSRFHEIMQRQIKRRTFEHHGLLGETQVKTGIPLKGKTLPLHGICDGVLINQGVNCYPFEFKMGERYVLNRGTLVQLSAYSLLYEENFGVSVSKAFIIVGKKHKPVPIEITNERRVEVKYVAEAIIKNCSLATLPSSTATDKQCAQCEFLNFCADRL